LQEDDEDDEDVEPVPAFKIEIAGSKVPQEKKSVNANRELRSLMPDVKQSTTKKWVCHYAVYALINLPLKYLAFQELTSSEELKDLYAGLERVLHELKNYKVRQWPSHMLNVVLRVKLGTLVSILEESVQVRGPRLSRSDQQSYGPRNYDQEPSQFAVSVSLICI